MKKEIKQKSFKEIIGQVNKEPIGSGGFGKVYKFKYNEKIYALKEIPLMNENDIIELEKEAKILSNFNNEYIVKYYDSFKKDNKFNIIMEYAGNTNLKNFIEKHRKKNQLIDEEILNNIIKQICIGVQEIHKLNIIHRDIKPENIFIDENNLKIKIGDFGISTINQYTYSGTGTWKYMAPERQTNKKYHNKVDIYALGCILYELFTLNNYYDDKVDEALKKVDSDIYDQKWQKLIDSMLAIDYHDRPDIFEVLDKLN